MCKQLRRNEVGTLQEPEVILTQLSTKYGFQCLGSTLQLGFVEVCIYNVSGYGWELSHYDYVWTRIKNLQLVSTSAMY